ncbi:Universal stress protein family protein [Anatilimnocola aggregata]|uniref:Universal stress protein family protein n=1 Tax=Anatilimnocola aggregata TaxID=2528021 RepID=A0A517YL11_9BACT|nr:universal stress protein [Anatilimnocola aggregata]QDU30916.1 Universal stress protein family protein [Anatilimnocola aggregata]
MDREHDRVCQQLSAACFQAGVNFDVRRSKGDPFEVIPREAQFHDLVVTGHLSQQGPLGEQGLTAAETLALLSCGVQPLLVLRDAESEIRRVLLVTDGLLASAKAIRQFLSQNLFPAAEQRLLAIGATDEQAQELLREMAEYSRSRQLDCESGWLRGSLRRMLLPYAQKWQADLVVMGIPKGNSILRTLLPDPARLILQQTNMGLYLMA